MASKPPLIHLTDGLAGWPIADTCDCTLEISINYQTYLEFSKEFRTILFSEDSTQMGMLTFKPEALYLVSYVQLV